MTQNHVPPPAVLTTCCHGSLEDVRAVLVQVDSYLRAANTPTDWVEDVNIILAEVLSNIARHGYKDARGRICLEIRLSKDELRCKITDTGQPFDPTLVGHVAPEPALLREGGYGWFLIRSLARALTYRRHMGVNCMTFWVPVGSRQAVVELAG